MLLSPTTSTSSNIIIDVSKLGVNEKEYNIKSDIIEVSNKNKDIALSSLPRKQNSSLNALPLPPRGINIKDNSLFSRRNINNVEMPKFEFNRSNKEVKLHNKTTDFLVAVKKCTGTDNYNEKASILFNNLESFKYNPSDYQLVENARYSNQLMYRKDTLIKSDDILLPANDVSSYDSPNMTIASQYPFNNKKSLSHYFNMLFENNINTVYILASNDDIKKDLSKLGSEYNKSNFEKDGFKYFRENF